MMFPELTMRLAIPSPYNPMMMRGKRGGGPALGMGVGFERGGSAAGGRVRVCRASNILATRSTSPFNPLPTQTASWAVEAVRAPSLARSDHSEENVQ